MKKTLLTLAALAAFTAAHAQQTFNFFSTADCDADGWLWLDSRTKIDKYCGWKNTFKIQYLTAGYEDNDFNVPEPAAAPDYQGLGTDGKAGGPGSRKGALELPVAGSDFAGYLAPANHGGGIMIQMPDCAKLELYLSAEQEDLYLCCEGNEGIVKESNIGMIKGGEFFPGFLGESLNGVKYAGAWNDIQNLEDDEFYISDPANKKHFKIQSEPGQARTIVFYNYMKESPLYIHGIRVQTYTDTNNGESGVAGVTDDAQNRETPAYNVHGVKVDDSYKGIVIQNGKKTIRR